MVVTDVRWATPDDAQLVAEAVEIASHGLMSTMFGHRWLEIFTKVTSIPGHEMSYEQARIEYRDSQPLGVALSSGADAARVDPIIARVVGRSFFRTAAIALAALPKLRFMSRHGTGEWYLNALAVLPGSRGLGVGRALLADTCQRAIENQATALTLDVDVTNTDAWRLYVREGFVETSRSPKAWLLGNAQVARLSKPLT